ncbi:AAA family ATPase [Micrococcales bacterium 31B]|nr:AAA family ATPase [Micrococcales bacterium 31B]
MRLLQLNLCGVGPFATLQSLDLATVGQTGLFLLEGPTGSGKSTLIDAMVFALYGHVASSTSEETRMVSTHRQRDQVPYVDLTFELTSGVYRIVRTPKFDREKKRGEGTTLVNQTAKLWRLPQFTTAPTCREDEPPGAVSLSTRASEVGSEVTRLIGLNREQFVQTVVLPQGEFATFLHAPGEKRRELLQHIFGTQHYEAMQAIFSARGKQAEADTLASQESLKTAAVVLGRATEASDTDAAHLEAAARELDLATLTQGGGDLVAAAQRRADTAEAAAATASATESDARVARDRLAAQVEAFSTWRAATQRVASLEERRPSVDAQRTAVALARRAAHVATAHTQLELARGKLRATEASWGEAVTRAVSAGQLELRAPGATDQSAGGAGSASEAGEADASREVGGQVAAVALSEHLTPDADLLGRLNALAEAYVAAISRRARLVALERELPARLAAWEREAAALAESRRDIEAFAATLGERTAQREALDLELTHSKAAAAGLDAANTAHQAAVERQRKVEAHAALTRNLEAAVAAQRTAEATNAKAQRARDDLTARRLRYVAGELAPHLRDDEPCPLCGSLEHPNPAGDGDKAVDLKTVNAAQRAAETAFAAAETARGNTERLHLESSQAEAELGDDTADSVSALVAATAATLHAVRAAMTRRDTLDATLREHDLLTLSLREQHEKRVQAATREATRLESQRENLTHDQAEVSGPVTQATLQAADEAANAVAKALATECRHVIEAAAAVSTAIRHTDSEAAAQGFATVADGLAAHWQTERLDRATEAITEFDRDLTAAVTRLNDSKCVDIAGVFETWRATNGATAATLGEVAEAPDDADIAAFELSLTAAHAERTQAHDEALARYSELRDRSAQANKTRADAVRENASMQAAIALHGARVAAARPLIRLKALAEGKEGNQRKMTLSTYVLLQRFERVVAAANVRLAGMLYGRYHLESHESKEGKSRSHNLGLGLAVRDLHTDTTRAPKTLSGGETFCVSLALALGLADTVSEEAGGIALDTLFIDEGFGSLDHEALEQVQRELDRLRAAGRCVGVVSHVEDMKQSIAEKISVRRGRHGTSTVTVCA